MERILDIILALIGQMPWISVMYCIHKVYENRPRHTAISYKEFTLESDR